MDFLITGFDRIVLDLDDRIQAIGLKWSLNDNTQATIQWQHWALDNYSINRSAVISRVLFYLQLLFEMTLLKPSQTLDIVSSLFSS